jgi:transposase
MDRKSYDRQLKIAAVKLVMEENMSVSEVAKKLSIHYHSLYRWISEYEEYGECAFPGHEGILCNSQYQTRKLSEKIMSLRQS